MLNPALVAVKNGKIETIEHLALSEGQKVLVTPLPDDATFWREISQQTRSNLPIEIGRSNLLDLPNLL